MTNVRNTLKTLAATLACICLLTTEAFSAGVPQKLPTDVIQFGKSGSASDKQLIFDFGLGGSNPFVSGSSSLLKYSKNGFSLGDGTNSTKNIFANIGGSNPFIQYNASNGDWEFSNDGVNATPVGSGSGASGIQLLTNPGFESGVTLDWTNTGGTFAASSSNPLVGRQSALFTASASNQSFQSGLHAVPLGLQGQACVGSLMYIGGDTNLTFQVLDNSSNVLASQVLANALTATTVNLPFLCPSSGSVRIKVKSSNAATLIKADNMFLGQNTLIQVSQASLVGTMSITGCTGLFTWTSGSYSDSTLSGCTYTGTGLLSAPSTQLPGFSAALPQGEYYVMASDEFTMSAGVEIAMTFTNGTISTRDVTAYTVSSSAAGGNGFSDAHFNFSVPNGSMTSDWRIQAKTLGGSGGLQANTTGGDTMVFSVYRFPSSDQQAVRADTSALSWSGYTTVTSGCNTASGTFVDVSTCVGATLTEQSNRNFGSVVTEASGLPGITFTPSKIGKFEVCAIGTIQGSSSQATSIRMVDASSNVLNNGVSVSPGTSGFQSYSLCGVESVTSIAPVTINLQMGVSGSTSGFTNGNVTGAPAINWNIVAIDQQIPAPVIIGSVASSSTGVEIINRAYITNNGTCAVSTQSGSWITGISHPATGQCTLTFSVYSARPSCTTTAFPSGTGHTTRIDSETSTTIVIDSYSATPTLVDDDFEIICMGPK